MRTPIATPTPTYLGLIACLMGMSLLSIVGMQQTAFAAPTAVEACQTALSRGQYAEAIKQAELASQSPSAWLCKGRAQAGLAQLAAATQSYERALKLNPVGVERISAHMLLGNVLREQQQAEAAISQYQTAQQLSQQDNIKRYVMINHHLIGEAWFELSQYAKALEAFQAGEKLAMNDNERADSYAHVASAYFALTQLDKAVEFQLKAVLMQKKAGTPDQYANASLTLGEYFLAQKDYIGAEKTVTRLLEYAQENGGAFYEGLSAIALSNIKRAQGDLSQATVWFQQAEKIANTLNDPELNAALSKAKP